jgi:polysaccharide biosynthesis protein PelE
MIEFFQNILDENFFLFIIYLFIANTLLGVLAAFTQRKMLPKHMDKKNAFVFFVTLNSIIPIFGIILTSLFVRVALSRQLEADFIPMDTVGLRTISDAYPVVKRLFGEGALLDIISNSYAPSMIKIKALQTMSLTKSAKTVSKIKESLSDKNDEVRLFAFSILDKYEKDINETIHELQNAISKSDDPIHTAHMHKRLAHTYWELLYLELSDSNLNDYFALKIEEEIAKSRISLPHSTSLYILEGRLHLKQDNFINAKISFRQALKHGADKARIAAYLAEIAYDNKDYAEVKNHLSSVDNNKLNYNIYTVTHTWNKNNASTN